MLELERPVIVEGLYYFLLALVSVAGTFVIYFEVAVGTGVVRVPHKNVVYLVGNYF